MKVLAVMFVLTLGGALAAENCYADVNDGCDPTSNDLSLPKCNALYGGFHGVLSEMQAYANLHLERSYEYLLTSTYFSNYQANRAGFSKLFRKLSDDLWEKSIDLMKHIAKRGGKMDFNQRSRKAPIVHRNGTLELHELGSLARALDVQKEMAEIAFYVHKEATRNREDLHDAEVAQYLEEEFIEKHADVVRNLAGHTNDVKRFISERNGQDVSLALYLFDEYLSKAV